MPSTSSDTLIFTALMACGVRGLVDSTDSMVMVLFSSISSCCWKRSRSSCTEKSSLGYDTIFFCKKREAVSTKSQRKGSYYSPVLDLNAS